MTALRLASYLVALALAVLGIWLTASSSPAPHETGQASLHEQARESR